MEKAKAREASHVVEAQGDDRTPVPEPPIVRDLEGDDLVGSHAAFETPRHVADETQSPRPAADGGGESGLEVPVLSAARRRRIYEDQAPGLQVLAQGGAARLKLSQDPFPRWWGRHEIGHRAREQTLTQKRGGLCSPSLIALIKAAAMAPRITAVGDGAGLALGRSLDRLGLEEGQEIVATEATLAFATD